MTEGSYKENYRDNFLMFLDEVKDTYYLPEEVPEIINFIEAYNSSNDFSKICFLGNSCKDTEFIDYNHDFRDKVSINICLNNDIRVPHVLLRDLIQEIGKESESAWGAPEYLFLLSERLLKETGVKYIETFGEMLFRNMDTYGACISIDYTNIDVKEVISELKSKDQKSKLILDLIEYFEDIINYHESKKYLHKGDHDIKRRWKLLITTMLIIISIFVLAIVGFNGSSHQTKLQLTDIVSYTSSDKVYNVSFQMVGDPEWPFGATTTRVKVIKKSNHKNKIIKDFTVQVQDDGSALQNSNCHVEWADKSVRITLTGSEQEDDVYIVPLPD